MRWSDLAFLHWPVAAEVLRPLIPAALEIDTFGGTGWLGVVPFRMESTRARHAPSVPTATDFPEVNVRTYVRGGGRAGVWFFSLDAASRLAVACARTLLNLPYHHASMTVRTEPVRVGDDASGAATGAASDWPSKAVHYRSVRGEPWNAHFDATYHDDGPAFTAAPGTLEHWLTERYCLFGQRRSGDVYFMDVHHLPWSLRAGTAVLRENTLASAAGVALPDSAPLVHVADALDVLAWLPEAVG